MFLSFNRDGRLQESDQILAIDGQVLDSGISHEEAISILQKASDQVELVVARGAIPRPGGLTDQGGVTPPVQQVCIHVPRLGWFRMQKG